MSLVECLGRVLDRQQLDAVDPEPRQPVQHIASNNPVTAQQVVPFAGSAAAVPGAITPDRLGGPHPAVVARDSEGCRHAARRS